MNQQSIEVHWPRSPGQAGPKLNPIHVGMNGIESAILEQQLHAL